MADFQRVIVVAGCVLRQDGKYLLLQEKKPSAYGLWNLPAGRVDEGETLEAAAARETLEESGFAVKVGKRVCLHHEAADEPVKHAYDAAIVGGELHIPEDEILAAKWLSYVEVQELAAQGKLRSPWVMESITAVEATSTE